MHKLQKLISSYLSGALSPAEEEQIQHYQQQNESIVTLFHVIDTCKTKIATSEDVTEFRRPVTFNQWQTLVVKVFGKNFSKADAKQFLSVILGNSSYLQHALQVLEFAHGEPPPSLDSLSGIAIRSDSELFQEMQRATQTNIELLPQQQRDRTKRNALFSWCKRWRWALAPIVIALVCVAFLITRSPQDSILREYFGAGRQPYPYSTLRDASPDRPIAILDQFQRIFSSGMFAYVLGNYPETIQHFESLYPLVLEIERSGIDENTATLLRNYYFYHALCRLQSAFKEKNSGKTHQINQGIEMLIKANQLESTFDLPDRDRETFFLALAYHMAGDKTTRNSYLGRIGSNSPFFGKSQQLMKQP